VMKAFMKEKKIKSCNVCHSKLAPKYDLKNAKVDEATARAVTDQLPAMRDALAQACTDGAWSAATRGCLVRANDHAGIEACEQQLTDEQRRDLDRVSRGTPETP